MPHRYVVSCQHILLCHISPAPLRSGPPLARSTALGIWRLGPGHSQPSRRFKKTNFWEFPSSPVVRTLHFHSWVQSLVGELRSYKLCCIAKTQIKMNFLPSLLPLHSQHVVYYYLVISHVRLFPWTVAHQPPLSMGFPRQEYWSGLLFPSPGDLLQPGIKLTSPVLEGGFFTIEPLGGSPAYF